MSRNAFECAELACARHLAHPGDTVIDGGAHLGLYALHLAQQVGPAGRVYAFEPHPETRALLSSAVALNGYRGSVSVVGSALGATSGPGVLRSPRRCSSHGAAFLDRSTGRVSRAERLVSVGIAALDDLDIQEPVVLIKLDVEGAEFAAIRGASRLIQRDRPAIMCELSDANLSRGAGVTSEAVMQTLAGFGYSAYEILADGQPGARLMTAPTARVSTVLFLWRPSTVCT